MNYTDLKKQTNFGWNTWHVRSVLSFAHLPEGFTINLAIKDFHTPDILRESLIGRNGPNQEHIVPGPRSYDGRCTRMSMEYYQTKLDIKTVVQNGEQIILITPTKLGGRHPVLIVEACQLWGGEGCVFKKNGRLGGEYDSRRFDVFIQSESPVVRGLQTYSTSPHVLLSLDAPIVVSTCPCTVEEAEALYAEAKAELDEANNAFAPHAEAYAAMKTCLAWDTIYEPEHDRICSPVSRQWCLGNRGYVLFDWDTYFAALIASAENKELAQLNAIAITDEVTPDGFVPNFGTGDGIKSTDRSQPPVGSFVCMEIYKKYPEKWFLEHVYPVMLSWNRWYCANRMTEEGYLCWGSGPSGGGHDWQAAAYESGLDNSPMFDGIPFDAERHIMLLADVGLMGLYVMDCRCLMEMAKVLGHEEVLPELEARKAKVEAALATLWDEEFGMFLNKDLRDGSLSRRISPTNFYALNADFVTEEQKHRMMAEHFYNPEEFWSEFIMPTIARNDPAYPDQDYWRGRIWAPTNFLAYAAMKYAGLNKECGDLAKKSEELLLKEWRLHGHVHENYGGDSGMGCDVHNSDRFYHWGGLLAYIAIDHAQAGGL